MVDENKNTVEKVEKPKRKRKTTAKKTEVREVKTAREKKENNLFVFVVGLIIVVGVIGILFGYTKDRFSKISQDGTQVTKNLENQVNDLKQQLTNLKETADKLERKNNENTAVVIDLFDKNRSIPKRVSAENWQVLKEKGLDFTVSFPENWENIKPIINTKQIDDKEYTESVVYLQPKGEVDFVNAVTIKTDYIDFADLSLPEKLDIFKELDLIDEVDVDNGKMIYFINISKNNKEVPTILILTDNNIYRATFNVADKNVEKYFEYREQFEEIISTFMLVDDSFFAEDVPEAETVEVIEE